MSTPFTPLYEQLLQHMSEGVCFIDPEQNITLWNLALEQLTGIGAEEAIEASSRDCILIYSSPVQSPDNETDIPFEQMNLSRGPKAFRRYLQHKDGHRILINLKVIPVELDSGSFGAFGIFSDASNQTPSEPSSRAMQKLMRIDPMTQLPNKRSLFDSIKGEYLRFVRYGTPFALISVAIDPDERFQHTPTEKKALLKWFGQQLSSGFRKADTPGRLRGATFAILLPHTNTQAAEKAAEKLRALIERTECPGIEASVTASFGCASITRADTIDRLMDRAKKALKAARKSGGNAVASL